MQRLTDKFTSCVLAWSQAFVVTGGGVKAEKWSTAHILWWSRTRRPSATSWWIIWRAKIFGDNSFVTHDEQKITTLHEVSWMRPACPTQSAPCDRVGHAATFPVFEGWPLWIAHFVAPGVAQNKNPT